MNENITPKLSSLPCFAFVSVTREIPAKSERYVHLIHNRWCSEFSRMCMCIKFVIEVPKQKMRMYLFLLGWYAAFLRKKPSCPQNFCPQFWGRKWVRQFYGRLEFLLSFCRKTSTSIKSLVLGGGGIVGFFGGGGEGRLYFFGRGDFSDSERQGVFGNLPE